MFTWDVVWNAPEMYSMSQVLLLDNDFLCSDKVFLFLPYTLMIESYYSCMHGMISRERNSAVKEKQRVGKHC